MVRKDTLAVASGVFFLIVAAVLFGVAAATKTILGPLAMTAAQLGVLAFYWFPWSFAWGSREPVVAAVFAVLLLVVSLVIIGWSGAILIGMQAPFLDWGPFLIVHLAANIALALRPRVYLWWTLGVWAVGPPAMGVVILIGVAHPGGYAPMQAFLNTLARNTGGSSDWGGAALVIFWLISLCSFTGTAAGLGFALAWRNVKKVEELFPADAPSPSDARGQSSGASL